MAYSTHHHHNQLLFNLGVPAMPANMAVKFHQPGALVVEKFGPSVTPLSTPITSQPSVPAFQFSAVSQDKLSVAVQLAKRDIKQKKLDESLKMQEKEKKSRKQNLGIQSRYTRDTQKKNTKNVVSTKEKASAMGKSRAKAVKSSSKVSSGWARPGSMVLHVRQSNYNNSSLPASGMSPPTRDIDPDPHLAPPNPQDQRSLQEIKHLRGEINKCLDQILKIEETAQNGGVAKRRLPGEDDLPECEVARRRAQRAEEQASRSARLVYNIQQQVKDIQHEIDKLRPGTVKPNKKSQLLSRLAAAHRGAIRALQAFVTQLEDHDWARGLPKTHQELTLLVRQLALCCAQLEVAGQSAVPDSVKNLIKDMAEYNVALEKEFHASPPRCTRPGPSIMKQQRSPASRQLFIDDSVLQNEEAKPPIRKELLKGDTACGGGGDSDKENVAGDGFKMSKSTKDRPNVTASSPERESVLRQGIAALIRAAESPQNPTKPKVPPLNLPRSQKVPKYSAYDRHVMKRRQKRGVIIPADLKAKRDRTGSALPVYTREGHFAEPTVASRLKEVPPHERPVPGSPRTPRKSSVSPRRGFPSPRVPTSPHTPRRSAHSLSPRPATSPGSPGRYARREIERQVILDREASKKIYELELYKRKEMQEIEKLRKELGKPDHWITDAEKKIRERLRPLLEKAQEIADRYEEIERKSLPGTQNVRRRKSDDVELNADILSEMIVDDLTQEVAQDLSRLALDEDVEQEARLMKEAPSLERIMQRLHEMENEQHEIRRRYATISYEDELPRTMRRTAYFDTGGQDRPRTPPPIQVDKTTLARSSSLQEITSDMESQYRPAEDEGAILFTKPQPQVRNFHLKEYKEPPTRKLDQKIQLNLSDDMISNILNNKERYAKFLKRTSTQAVGRFNPWQVVEQVSDEILEECLLDIAKELEDINSEIVNHVYRAEFNEVKSASSDEGQQTEET